MSERNERRHQKSIWDLIPLIAVIGSIVTAWITLNNTMNEIEITQKYDNKLTTIKFNNVDDNMVTLSESIDTIKGNNKELKEQINDVERTVTHLYSSKRKK